jgi:hypothetical protein
MLASFSLVYYASAVQEPWKVSDSSQLDGMGYFLVFTWMILCVCMMMRFSYL